MSPTHIDENWNDESGLDQQFTVSVPQLLDCDARPLQCDKEVKAVLTVDDVSCETGPFISPKAHKLQTVHPAILNTCQAFIRSTQLSWIKKK